MSGKSKTALTKAERAQIGPQKKIKTVKVLEFRRNRNGNLSPKFHFEREEQS